MDDALGRDGGGDAAEEALEVASGAELHDEVDGEAVDAKVDEGDDVAVPGLGHVPRLRDRLLGLLEGHARDDLHDELLAVFETLDGVALAERALADKANESIALELEEVEGGGDDVCRPLRALLRAHAAKVGLVGPHRVAGDQRQRWEGLEVLAPPRLLLPVARLHVVQLVRLQRHRMRRRTAHGEERPNRRVQIGRKGF